MTVALEPLPPLAAIAALERRGARLDPSFSWQDAWQEEHAAMFTVAKSAGFDILQDILDGLQRSLKEGRTFRDFSRELTPLLKEKGWWGRQLVEDPATGERVAAQLGSPQRLRTIFDTNMRVSYASGHWAAFERTKASRPLLRYVAILDERTRPAHRARHNLVLPVDDPYWEAWAPPCGWNCRCTLQSLSQRDADRLKGEGEDLRFEPPADTFRNFVNKRTGEISRVPDGIDPGWAYNPGKSGAAAGPNSALAAKTIGAPPPLAAAAIADALDPARFARFMADPQGDIPMFLLPPEIGAATEAKAAVALLSAETMRKQLERHPELTLADYLQLPAIAEEATLILQDGDTQFAIVRLADDRWRHVAVKTTRTGLAAFLLSYRFSSGGDIARLLRKAGVRILRDRR